MFFLTIILSLTGFAPNKVIYWKLLPNTSDRKLNLVQDAKINQEEAIKEIGRRLEKIQEGHKKQYDKKVYVKTTFKTGDFVVLDNSSKTVCQVRSFEPKYIGPFEVVRLIGDTNYELIDRKTGKTIVVHYNRIAKYTVRDHNHSLEQLVDEDTLEIYLFVYLLIYLIIHLLIRMNSSGRKSDPNWCALVVFSLCFRCVSSRFRQSTILSILLFYFY